MSDLVSIVMPVYNAGPYVEQAIGSCLSQTHQNFELLIIDDASSDNSRQVVQSFDDPRIRLFELPANRGPGPARNVGLEAARGKWVTLLDADDFYHPQRLERLLCLARKHGPYHIYIDRQARWELGTDPGVYTDQYTDLTSWEVSVHPASAVGSRTLSVQAFFSKELLDQSGARFPNVKASEKTVFLIRLVMPTRASIFEYSGRMYIYRRTPDSLYTRTPERFRESQRAYKLVLDEFPNEQPLTEAIERRVERMRREEAVVELKVLILERRFCAATGRIGGSPRILWEVATRVPSWMKFRRSLKRRRQSQIQGGSSWG